MDDSVAAVAEQLRQAESSRMPCAPVRDRFAATDTDAAYRVQMANVAAGEAAGRRVVGRKVGLTNPAVQAQLGVDQPDFGTLFADMAYPDGVEIDSGRLIQPRAEAEVALVLDGDLDRSQPCIVDLLNVVGYAVASLEIVDSRIVDWDIRITDTIADNGSSGLFVIGNRPVPLGALDLRAVAMSMTVNGEVVSQGTGAACLGNPLNAALWLADIMFQRGTPLRAGDIILTGALGPMVSVEPGDEVAAELTGLGPVTTVFSN